MLILNIDWQEKLKELHSPPHTGINRYAVGSGNRERIKVYTSTLAKRIKEINQLIACGQAIYKEGGVK